MVLSGEGADEIFGGYLYFHSAPSSRDFHKETVSRVRNLHLSDCLRANKSTMSWGVELRVPFLDTGFLNHSMSIRPEDRMPDSSHKHRAMEKFILRDAFTKGRLNREYLRDRDTDLNLHIPLISLPQDIYRKKYSGAKRNNFLMAWDINGSTRSKTTLPPMSATRSSRVHRSSFLTTHPKPRRRSTTGRRSRTCSLASVSPRLL